MKHFLDRFFAAEEKFGSKWHFKGRLTSEGKGVKIRFCRKTVENKSLRQWQWVNGGKLANKKMRETGKSYS